MRVLKIVISSLLFLLTFSANAATISIDLSQSPYKSDGRFSGVGTISDAFERSAAMFAAYGVYNKNHPANPIKRGDTITVKYQDGSSEKGLVANEFSTVGIQPIPGTQREGGGGGGGAHDPSAGGGGGGSVGIVGSGGGGVGGGSGGSIIVIIGDIKRIRDN